MVKYLPFAWNSVVCLVVAWLTFCYRYWLFDLPLENYRNYYGDASIPSIMNGPIYLGLFVAYGLHFSTVYNQRTHSRLSLLIITTCLPLFGIAFVMWRNPFYIRPGDYFNHGGLLLFLSVVVVCCRRNIIQLLFAAIRLCGRTIDFPAKESAS